MHIIFQLNHDFIPGDFFKADVTVDTARHLILATDQMLHLLSEARVW